MADTERVLAAFNGVLVNYTSEDLGKVIRRLGAITEGRDQVLSQVIDMLASFNDRLKEIDRMEEPIKVKVIGILSTINERHGDLLAAFRTTEQVLDWFRQSPENAQD